MEVRLVEDNSRKHPTLGIGVIGYGYWGPNIVRNFHSTPNARVVSVCDMNPKALERVHRSYPSVAVTRDPSDILNSPEIDAVAIVTPISHHFSLAKRALEEGKHVFVEKPFTRTASEAEELIELAERKNLLIMVDHTFIFSPAVRKIRELIEDNVLGTLYYYDSTRVNLGLFQHEANVVWDLAPHDLSIMDYLIHGKPEAVVATGEKHVNGVENIAFITVYFANKVIAHLNVNWLSPVKVRSTMIGAEKKMLVWNDLEADEKIKIYDKGVERSNATSEHELRVSYRAGDLCIPRLEQGEALAHEMEYFVDCVTNNKTPINDGLSGLRVVQLLETIDRSMLRRGGMVYCNPASTRFARTENTIAFAASGKS